MSRYIDVEDFKEIYRKRAKNKDWYDLFLLDKTPTADVKPIVRGEWILNCISQKLLEDYDEEYYVECSLCHRTEDVPFELENEKMLKYAEEHYPFCHCGADMRSNNAERISETE